MTKVEVSQHKDEEQKEEMLLPWGNKKVQVISSGGGRQREVKPHSEGGDGSNWEKNNWWKDAIFETWKAEKTSMDEIENSIEAFFVLMMFLRHGREFGRQ